MKTLWLIDGGSLACRSFFAFIRNPLRNSKGENTSAVFGFVNSLLKLLNEKKPEYLLISFDAGVPTFRHEQFKKYKATRPKLPRELHPQIPIIKKVVETLGIQTLEIEGIEADDTIGTIAKLANQRGFEVIIFSEDKDFLQLESPGLQIFNPRAFEFTNAQEKLGIPSNRISDFLALAGDTIDNIPGVPGIGPKTATQLISEFGGVKEIIENAHKIKREKIREVIEDFKDQILLSKELATIKTDCEIEIKPEELKIGEIDEPALLSILKELDFFSIIKKLKLSKPKKYEMGENLDDFLNSIKESLSIVLFPPYFSLAHKEGEASVFKEDADKLTTVMENPKITKITPDSKILFTRFDVKGEVFDLGLASYLLKPDLKEHSLDNLATLWLGEPLSTLDLKKRGVDGIPSEELVNWLGGRADAAYSLYKVLKKELEKKELYKLFHEIEVPLARVLADMEKRGVLIDRDYFANESAILETKLKEIEEEIYLNAGERFNLRSPQQLSYMLFEKLGLPKSKHRKTGYSTDQSVLEELAKDYELPKKILSYREFFKLKSTYLDAIPSLADSANRVHTNWQQTITTTGRLSSANPNLQNIPRREIRKGFIAPEGWIILSADYSQIELRILASISEDPTLVEAFQQGKDIHTRTTSLIFNIPESQVTRELREKAKMVNFGIVYGMGPYGLSQRLRISVEEAATFIASYFLTYPRVKQWIDEELEFVRKNGYVETLLGRKRWLPGINSPNARVREFEERAAINAPIQGSAADMIKIAMIKIYERLKPLKSKLIIQVHDELVLEVPEEEIEEVERLVREEMENAGVAELVGVERKSQPLGALHPARGGVTPVPVVVDIGIGKNWYEAH